MKPKETIAAFDAYLDQRGLSFEAVIIGGSALALLDVTTRQTRDCDVLAPSIPEEVTRAAEAFAAERTAEGEVLDGHWFNDGPGSLARDLPDGWGQRVQLAYEGRALKLFTLGRLDLLRSKLFTLCDRGLDIGDCLALAPTADEIAQITTWLTERDGNPMWPDHVRGVLADLARRLGHES